jgi:hypothetical protein
MPGEPGKLVRAVSGLTGSSPSESTEVAKPPAERTVGELAEGADTGTGKIGLLFAGGHLRNLRLGAGCSASSSSLALLRPHFGSEGLICEIAT